MRHKESNVFSHHKGVKRIILLHKLLFFMGFIVSILFYLYASFWALFVVAWPMYHAIALYNYAFIYQKRCITLSSKFYYRENGRARLKYYIKCTNQKRYEVKKNIYDALSPGDKLEIIAKGHKESVRHVIKIVEET